MTSTSVHTFKSPRFNDSFVQDILVPDYPEFGISLNQALKEINAKISKLIEVMGSMNYDPVLAAELKNYGRIKKRISDAIDGKEFAEKQVDKESASRTALSKPQQASEKREREQFVEKQVDKESKVSRAALGKPQQASEKREREQIEEKRATRKRVGEPMISDERKKQRVHESSSSSNVEEPRMVTCTTRTSASVSASASAPNQKTIRTSSDQRIDAPIYIDKGPTPPVELRGTSTVIDVFQDQFQQCVAFIHNKVITWMLTNRNYRQGCLSSKAAMNLANGDDFLKVEISKTAIYLFANLRYLCRTISNQEELGKEICKLLGISEEQLNKIRAENAGAPLALIF